MEIFPSLTAFTISWQYALYCGLDGTMLISTPALKAWMAASAKLAAVLCTVCSIMKSSQSETTKPLKPQSFLSVCVSSW